MSETSGGNVTPTGGVEPRKAKSLAEGGEYNLERYARQTRNGVAVLVGIVGIITILALIFGIIVAVQGSPTPKPSTVVQNDNPRPQDCSNAVMSQLNVNC